MVLLAIVERHSAALTAPRERGEVAAWARWPRTRSSAGCRARPGRSGSRSAPLHWSVHLSCACGACDGLDRRQRVGRRETPKAALTESLQVGDIGGVAAIGREPVHLAYRCRSRRDWPLGFFLARPGRRPGLPGVCRPGLAEMAAVIAYRCGLAASISAWIWDCLASLGEGKSCSLARSSLSSITFWRRRCGRLVRFEVSSGGTVTGAVPALWITWTRGSRCRGAGLSTPWTDPRLSLHHRFTRGCPVTTRRLHHTALS